jgi:hypothetical protein
LGIISNISGGEIKIVCIYVKRRRRSYIYRDLLLAFSHRIHFVKFCTITIHIERWRDRWTIITASVQAQVVVVEVAL